MAEETKIGKVPVFLAWSGEASKKMALVLHEYLPLIINATDPFMSEKDIDKGTRWPESIAERLQASQCGILCLTPENIQSHWIHFEAGAISKIVDESRVCTLLVGVKESHLKAPLSIFQATEYEEEDFRKLIIDLNKICGGMGLSEHHLMTSFDKFWPDINEKFTKIEEEIKRSPKKGAAKPAGKPAEAEIQAMVEEILLRTRDRDRQMENIERRSSPYEVDLQTERPSPSDSMHKILIERLKQTAKVYGCDFVRVQSNADEGINLLLRGKLNHEMLSSMGSVAEEYGVTVLIRFTSRTETFTLG